MLRGQELEGGEDEWSGYERQPTHSVEVEYSPEVPIETFDFIIVDECHRSIYGVWRQVLEYFDAHLSDSLPRLPIRPTASSTSTSSWSTTTRKPSPTE